MDPYEKKKSGKHLSLDSVPTSKFDPNSSPILRRLARNEPLVPSKLNKSSRSQSIPAVDASTLESPESHSVPTPQQMPLVKDSLDSAPKNPFASTVPFPAAAFPTTPAKLDLQEASLEIQQLHLTLPLKFEDPIEKLTRERISSQKFSFQIPEGFFEPIISEGASDGGPAEHCVIEQAEKGVFMLKDRNNLQKTYINNAFVDDTGVELKEGDQIIFPVTLNGQTSSLTLIFHNTN